MRGDQLARKWRLIPAIEASPNGLREETGIKTIHRLASHAKPQSSPGKRSILLLPFLKIFLPHCFRKYPHFFLFSLARDIMPPKAAKFSKTKEIFAPFAPLREGSG